MSDQFKLMTEQAWREAYRHFPEDWIEFYDPLPRRRSWLARAWAYITSFCR